MGLALRTLLVLVCCTAPLSFAQEQRLGDVNLTAQANLSGTPMIGVDYAVTDQASVRLVLGYFQFDEGYSPCTGEYTSPYPVDCPLVRYHATTYQYSGSIAGLYRVVEESGVSPYAGVELQLVYAGAPARRQWINFEEHVGMAGRRFSASGLIGLSIRPVSWLALFGEMGLGYVHGVPVSSFTADLDSSANRWGITHVSPGLRVFL